MKKEQLAFGIDIGGTNTKFGLFNHDGELRSYRSIPTPKGSDPAKFIEQLAQECEQMMSSEFGVKLGDPALKGVGVGAPMVNYFTGRIEHAPNLGWKNVDLKNLFEKHFKCPAIVENDANLAAMGENKWGAGRELTDFVMITLGTGVGSGLILGDKLYRGYMGLGGEGGHMIIPHSKQRLCSCGGMNHLESYLSASGIKQTIKELVNEDWTIEKLGILFAEGDLKAKTIIENIADELVLGLVSICVLFGPQAIVIGGGVSKLGDKFNKVIEQKLNELVHFSLKGKVRILTATVSSDKGAVYGGAALVFAEV